MFSDIIATKDRWLIAKSNFKVDNLHIYEGRNDLVSSLFYPDTKSWDVERVQQSFSIDDAKAILATRVPQQSVGDRIAWSRSKDGLYTVKSGYVIWHDLNIGNYAISQSKVWSRIWRIALPHKMRIFWWRFCRNNLTVRNKLKAKGVNLPLICPMCNVDVEHLYMFSLIAVLHRVAGNTWVLIKL